MSLILGKRRVQKWAEVPISPTSGYVTPKVPTDEIYRAFKQVTLKKVYDQKVVFTIF